MEKRTFHHRDTESTEAEKERGDRGQFKQREGYSAGGSSYATYYVLRSLLNSDREGLAWKAFPVCSENTDRWIQSHPGF